jgi:hypothetical protein
MAARWSVQLRSAATLCSARHGVFLRLLPLDLAGRGTLQGLVDRSTLHLAEMIFIKSG